MSVWEDITKAPPGGQPDGAEETTSLGSEDGVENRPNGHDPQGVFTPPDAEQATDIAGEDAARIEAGRDPPPSADVIASTHDALVRRTQTLRDQGRNLAQLIEPPHGIFLTAFPELCYHPSRRAEVERAFFSSPKISEHPSEDEIALQFVASVGEYARFVAV